MKISKIMEGNQKVRERLQRKHIEHKHYEGGYIFGKYSRFMESCYVWYQPNTNWEMWFRAMYNVNPNKS